MKALLLFENIKLLINNKGMDYYQGYEDAMRQARACRTTGLIGFIVRIILSLIYCAFIYVPLIMLAYWAANKMSALYSNDVLIKFGLSLGLAYLLFAFIYLVKGLLIGLRTSGRFTWGLLWVMCVAITAGGQSLVAQNLLETFFESRNVANSQIWSWLGACLVALLIYSHYQLLTNVAPRVVFWSYQFGFLLSRSNEKRSKNTTPQRSASYFENGSMKVSYKKKE
jgi:hypothetical protein